MSQVPAYRFRIKLNIEQCGKEHQLNCRGPVVHALLYFAADGFGFGGIGIEQAKPQTPIGNGLRKMLIDRIWKNTAEIVKADCCTSMVLCCL